MAKINRSKLSKIIQEEIKKVALEEGFLDTFKILGADLKKWYKNAEMQGDIVGSERDSRKAIEATKKAIETNLNKLRTKYGPDGERGDEGIKARMGELKAQFDALDAGGDGANQVVDAIADASDGTVEAPSQSLDQVLAKHGYKGKPKSGKPEEAPKGAEALPQEAPEVDEKVKAVTLSVPDDVLELVISYLAQSNKYRGKKASELMALIGKPGVLKGMARGVQRQAKKAQVAEGKVTVTRQALKEVLSLLAENGV